MCCDWSVSLGDAKYCVADGFQCDSHIARVCVDHQVWFQNKRDMPAPKKQVVALVGCALWQRVAQQFLLLVTVTGTRNAAGQQGRLDKARTINAPTAVAAPKIGRADKQKSDAAWV